MNADKKNILLIQTAFIGDVILTTPLIAAIKHFFPESRLTVMVKPEAVSLLRSHPLVDELFVIHKRGEHRGVRGMLRVIRQIRAMGFTTLLSPHKSHRTGFIAAFSGIPERYGFRSAGFSRFAYTHLLEEHRELPEIRRLLTFLEESLAPGAAEFSSQMHLHETEESEQEAEALLAGLKVSNPILVATSSVWPTKRWTPEGFAELIPRLMEQYDRPVLLVGSQADDAVTQLTLRKLRESGSPEVLARVHNVCGRTGLMGLYSLMKRSLLLVSNDSAPVHFACAARIPVVALFGPTVPSLGYAPLTPESRVAEVEDLPCRPCGSHGGNRCPEGHFRCMRELSPERVMERVHEVMP